MSLWLRPHALGHNGACWHVRAWCEQNGDLRDFTLSRIAEVEWRRGRADLPAEDKDWKQWVTLRVRPHQDLNEAQRQAVERDYAMRNGVLKLKVRKAMEGYLRDHLGLAMADGKPPVRLLECDEDQLIRQPPRVNLIMGENHHQRPATHLAIVVHLRRHLVGMRHGDFKHLKAGRRAVPVLLVLRLIDPIEFVGQARLPGALVLEGLAGLTFRCGSGDIPHGHQTSNHQRQVFQNVNQSAPAEGAQGYGGLSGQLQSVTVKVPLVHGYQSPT
ncbi:MAG: WYL domain-containing protein [Verrucomicrobia bacterium]|nr:WYL domain-containing protein [Verrucomicrobiota bacterium]